MQLGHTLIIERYFPTHQHVQDDTKTPDVYFRACILPRLQEFRRSKVQTTTERFEMALGCEQVAQTEIDNFDIPRLAYQDILDFQVSVNDAIPMAIIQSTCYLAAKLPSLFLLQPAMRDDVVQHLTSIDILKQHVPMVIGTHHISHCADIRVIEQSDDGCFSGSPDFLGVICTFAVSIITMLVSRLPWHNLDSNLLSSLQILSQLYFAHAPCSYRFA